MAKIKQIKRTYDHGDTQLRIFDGEGNFIGYANYGMAAVNIGKIHYLEIHPQLRRQKLATQLLPHILNDLRCRGADKVIIGVAREKVAIWEDLGFEEILAGMVSVGNMEKDIIDLEPVCPVQFPEDERASRWFEDIIPKRQK